MSDGGDERRREREDFAAWQAGELFSATDSRSVVGEVAETTFVVAFWASCAVAIFAGLVH